MIFELIERAAAFAQGKGYGTSTIRQEVRRVARLLGRAPRLAVDAGANVGLYSAELRRRFPDLEIHAFEPSRTNIARLNARFAADAGIRIVPFAVSDRAGSATLYSDAPGSGLASLTRRELEHHGIAFDSAEAVTTLRLEDYWIGELGRREIDIVKLDVEGHELAALQGFGAAIGSIRVVQFEFGGTNIDTRTYFRDFWHFFGEHGFELFRIAPLGLQRIRRYREVDEFFSTTNFIARRPRG